MTGESGEPGGSGGGPSPSCLETLADQVFELSSKLGALRQQSAVSADALRSAAEVGNRFVVNE